MNYSNKSQFRQIIKQALREDIGREDLTTRLTVPKEKRINALIVAWEKGVLCGMDLARLIFQGIDKNLRFTPLVADGQRFKRKEILARVYGPATKILTAERVVLNFLGMLSGISTKTHTFVEKVKPYKVKILDTRKTLPGLRALEKYAVRMGGGHSHRFRLDEMVLIKDNHIRSIGLKTLTVRLKEIIKKIKKEYSRRKKIEVEVKNLSEFKQVLRAGPDIIMLDNMKIGEVKKAVKMRNSSSPNVYSRRPKLEVSGRISLGNVKRYASCDIDFISIGQLTKDVDSIDMSFEIL